MLSTGNANNKMLKLTIQYLYQFELCIDDIKTRKNSKMFFKSS